MNIEEQFEKFENEFHNFNLIKDPQFKSPEICGFAAIEKIRGEKIDFAAEHDVLYCGGHSEDDRDLTDDEVILLLRCGILWNSEFDSFFIFT